MEHLKPQIVTEVTKDDLLIEAIMVWITATSATVIGIRNNLKVCTKWCVIRWASSTTCYKKLIDSIAKLLLLYRV